MRKNSQSALLAKYFNAYKKDPRSRVFAPLAEAYRKLGMLEDAYKILREGIRQHPTYTLGYIVLANCYYDQEKYELTYNTLRPIIAQNADNISLQKIFALACIHLGHLEEALDTFKYLLFMNPGEKYFAEQVKRLEDDLMVGHKKLSLDQLIKSPENLQNLPAPTRPVEDNDWVQVNFNKPPEKETPKLETISPDDSWVVERQPSFENHPLLKTQNVTERSLEDDFYADEFEEEFGNIEDVNSSSIISESPIVSHTLIDLYCAQHYYDKAVELLEKIIELNPNDSVSINKLNAVKELQQSSELPRSSKATEQEGHDELIQLIENQVKTKNPKELKVEKALHQFLSSIKDRSQHYR